MDSIDFLNDYFKSYNPYDHYLFSVFFTSFKKLNIVTQEELSTRILYIRDNIEKRDLKLISNYALSYSRPSMITKILKLLSPKTFRNISYFEINNIHQYIRSKKSSNNNYNHFKFFFPKVSFVEYYNQPYVVLKPNIYYLIRNELISCKDKKEIFTKLNSHEFKLFVVNWFYDIGHEMPNKRKSYYLVENVCSEIIFTLDYSNPKKLYLDSIEDTEYAINKILDINLLSFISKSR
jgi:hypothetical protein